MNTSATQTNAIEVSLRKIILASLAALMVSGLILTVFILPAEFNQDPLGLGEALGVKGLSEPQTIAKTVRKEDANYHQDMVSFKLLPFEFVEYKYALSEGSALLYSWTAQDAETLESSLVSFDFHGESHDVEGYEQSYSEGNDDHENGTFTAPFNGIHGWFWGNHGAATVTVTLKTTGFYTESLEFRDGFVKKEVLTNQP